ncbi:hypothetical protein DL768_010362 [Monosporascus sp. mg162]|nr:hypothetical protein DL768_010362 [Monosporascus sp. mg162]
MKESTGGLQRSEVARGHLLVLVADGKAGAMREATSLRKALIRVRDLYALLVGSAGHVRGNDDLVADLRGQIDRLMLEASPRPESPSLEERGSFWRRKIIVMKQWLP